MTIREWQSMYLTLGTKIQTAHLGAIEVVGIERKGRDPYILFDSFGGDKASVIRANVNTGRWSILPEEPSETKFHPRPDSGTAKVTA